MNNTEIDVHGAPEHGFSVTVAGRLSVEARAHAAETINKLRDDIARINSTGTKKSYSVQYVRWYKP